MFTRTLITAAVALCLLTTNAWGAGEYIDIYPKDAAEIMLVLDTLDRRVTEAPQAADPPIVMMLHGQQARRFLRSHYRDNQSLVDTAAKLSAYGVLDVKICETWLKGNQYDRSELFPFITPVPFGAGELERLESEAGYAEYTVDL